MELFVARDFGPPLVLKVEINGKRFRRLRRCICQPRNLGDIVSVIDLAKQIFPAKEPHPGTNSRIS
jgi:hypothetical protein